MIRVNVFIVILLLTGSASASAQPRVEMTGGLSTAIGAEPPAASRSAVFSLTLSPSKKPVGFSLEFDGPATASTTVSYATSVTLRTTHTEFRRQSIASLLVRFLPVRTGRFRASAVAGPSAIVTQTDIASSSSAAGAPLPQPSSLGPKYVDIAASFGVDVSWNLGHVVVYTPRVRLYLAPSHEVRSFGSVAVGIGWVFND